MRIFCLMRVESSFDGSTRTDSSQMAPSCRDDSTSFYIKSSRLMGAVMPFLDLVQSQLSRVDLPCSPHATTLRVERKQERSKRLEFFSFLFIYIFFLC